MLIYIKNKVINTDKIIAAERAKYGVTVYLETTTSVFEIHIPAEEKEAKKILVSLADKIAL